MALDGGYEMIEVEPMPNELSIGHEGRLAWVNGRMSAKEVSQLISSTLIERGIDVADMPKLHQLALVSNLTPTDYAQRHSMLPVLRISAKPDAVVLHGAVNAQTYSRRLGMLTQRRGSYCCIKCIEEDLRRRNTSWFRRTHHLIGVDWCPVHCCDLSRIDEPNAFSRVPQIWLEENKLRSDAGAPLQLSGDGFLLRYVNIATALLDRDRPLLATQVNGRLAKRARKLGLLNSVQN